MELSVLNIKGEDTGRKVNLSDSIFNIKPNDHVIYLAVKHYRATVRQGTHKSKERSEITGSTRKLRKQKGTGFARVGNIKNPLFKGGGRVFGPKPRDYGFKLNKKIKELAKKSALSYKAKENNILILESFNFEEPKTKNYVDLLNNLNIAANKSLLVLEEKKENIYLSHRNIKGSKVITVNELNIYDILNAKYLLLSENAVNKLEEHFIIKEEPIQKEDKVINNGVKAGKSKKVKVAQEEIQVS